MIIVKLGGSLYSSPYLKQWCDQLASLDQQSIVIVPGGGPFADQVRDADQHWNLPEEAAHEMAVLAMQQFGLLISTINKTILPLQILSKTIDRNPVVWMPYRDVLAHCDYPKNWQTTSDSLALWLACQLSADHLCLVKSAKVGHVATEQLSNTELVDDYFPVASESFSGKTHFYHASQATHFVKDINNGKFN